MDASRETANASNRALLIALGAPVLGITVLAAWLWAERGAAILLDIGSLFCL
ncbi:MAG: hypothetical protein AB7O88_00775 [Reyranellaceae bacterium]